MSERKPGAAAVDASCRSRAGPLPACDSPVDVAQALLPAGADTLVGAGQLRSPTHGGRSLEKDGRTPLAVTS